MSSDSIWKEPTEYEARVNGLVNKIIANEIEFKEKSGSNNPINKKYVPVYHVVEGKNYTKILNTALEVWGFVVKKSDDKFKKGDILKAKSKDEPIRDFARGNIYNQTSLKDINWFGAE